MKYRQNYSASKAYARKFFGVVALCAMLNACASAPETSSSREISPITHVARLIRKPFGHSVEKDLRSLIHQVAQNDGGCSGIASNEKLISQLITPESLQALGGSETAYWDKALPADSAKKQMVLSSVEQNLALHMNTLQQTIKATGLQVAGNTVVISSPTLLASATPVLSKAKAGFIPLPVFKHRDYAMGFVPVPVLKNPALLKEAAKGGPYVPPYHGDLSTRYRELSNTLKQLVALENLYTTLPIGKPMPEGTITSGFGVRLDPFNRRWAQHTGMDFSSSGTPAAYATGKGKVIFAARDGDYGNMVIVDHGHGITSRYAHLSRISVREGKKVVSGTKLGYQGSTGRSTGNHLHYEVRINNRPVNPVNFVNAGASSACYKTAGLGAKAL